MRKALFVSIALLALAALVAVPVLTAPTVTKTLLYQDRYGKVYNVAVTMDSHYEHGGEVITVGLPVEYAFIQDCGSATAESTTYYLNIDSANFASGTFDLLVYKVMPDSSALRECVKATNLSALTGIEIIVRTKR
jgi:hypothetical protein